MKLCETAMNCPVEIEFAGLLGRHFDDISEFDFLQVRPMVKEEGTIEIDFSALRRDEILRGPSSPKLKRIGYAREHCREDPSRPLEGGRI